MKKLFCVTALALVAAATSAGIVEETKSKPELAGSLVVAPFDDVVAKVSRLGTMINNPLMPMLVGSAMQQQLTQSYGAFNSSSPICWLSYVQTPAWEVAMTNDDMTAFSELHDVALVYPSVDKAAMMLLNNPGSTKTADGTLHLLASETRPRAQYAAFSKDGRYCAFASTAALAKRALVDFGNLDLSADAGKARPLMRLSLTKRGIEALSSAKGMKAMTGKYVGAEAAIDLDDRGVSIAGSVAAKPGAVSTPDCALPPKALDVIPAAAPLFFAGSGYMVNGCMSEDEFRAYAGEQMRTLDEVVAQAKSNPSLKKYHKFIQEIRDVVADLLNEASAPKPGDWFASAIAFDGAGRPGVVTSGSVAAAQKNCASAHKAMSRFAAALERQFPKSGVLVEKGAGVYEFDAGALIDLAASLDGVKPGDDAYKALAPAKENVKAVLGGGSLVMSLKCEGSSIEETIACPGFARPAAAGGVARRIAAVLPEAEAERPALVFHAAVYALLRDVVLPRVVQLMDAESGAQFKTMFGALPPAAANGGIAGAAWLRGDGSMRFQVRVAGDELKNFGALFNAFTAASMSAAMGGGDEDEE